MKTSVEFDIATGKFMLRELEWQGNREPVEDYAIFTTLSAAAFDYEIKARQLRRIAFAIQEAGSEARSMLNIGVKLLAAIQAMEDLLDKMNDGEDVSRAEFIARAAVYYMLLRGAGDKESKLLLTITGRSLDIRIPLISPTKWPSWLTRTKFFKTSMEPKYGLPPGLVANGMCIIHGRDTFVLFANKWGWIIDIEGADFGILREDGRVVASWIRSHNGYAPMYAMTIPSLMP